MVHAPPRARITRRTAPPRAVPHAAPRATPRALPRAPAQRRYALNDAGRAVHNELWNVAVTMYPNSCSPIATKRLSMVRHSTQFFSRIRIIITIGTTGAPVFSRTAEISIVHHTLSGTNYGGIAISSASNLVASCYGGINTAIVIGNLHRGNSCRTRLNVTLIGHGLTNVRALFLPTSPVLRRVSDSVIGSITHRKNSIANVIPSYIIPVLTSTLTRRHRQGS